jgi:choline/glycine/proline betaine transport protein
VTEGNEDPTPRLPTSTRFEIRTAVFVPAVAIIVAFVALGVLFTETLQTLFGNVQEFIAGTMGWFYILTVTGLLVFVIWLAASPHGRKRLGPDDSRPNYSYLSWFAMLFSAGMGIGLLFFSVAEPISHFGIETPPYSEGEAGTATAAAESMNVTFFHWGLHAWAIYIVVGLALGYFAYRRNLPLTLRSAFYPILGDRIRRWPGDAIDTLAIVGTLFGVATSLGLGAIQISAGLSTIADVEAGIGVQLLIIAIITAIATGSVVAGLDKGIRRLSVLNICLGALLTMFVLFAGPTAFLFDAFITNIGTYLQNLPSLSLETATYSEGDWQADWTLFYWGWWISWSPFVGMFIARISRGRTVREFIVVVLLVPTTVTFVVLTVFGQTAIHSELFGPGGITDVAAENLDFALFEMLGQLPIATVTSVLAIVVIATFFITSSDSGSLVDDIHASGGSLNPKVATRVFWALSEGFVAAVLLSAGGETGLEALQQASLATGLPLALLLIAICYTLTKALRADRPTTQPRSIAPQGRGTEPDDGARVRGDPDRPGAPGTP